MNSQSIKYYSLYMKYKAQYLSLKQQTGGQVVIDPMIDDVLNDNSLENITIKIIDKSNDNINYKKIIKVNAGDEKGTIHTKDYDSNISHNYDIDRGEVEKLLKEINHIWDLPNRYSDSTSNFDLYIKHGDKIWPNKNISRFVKTRKNKKIDSQDIYNDIVTRVLSFE